MVRSNAARIVIGGIALVLSVWWSYTVMAPIAKLDLCQSLSYSQNELRHEQATVVGLGPSDAYHKIQLVQPIKVRHQDGGVTSHLATNSLNYKVGEPVFAGFYGSALVSLNGMDARALLNYPLISAITVVSWLMLLVMWAATGNMRRSALILTIGTPFIVALLYIIDHTFALGALLVPVYCAWLLSERKPPK